MKIKKTRGEKFQDARFVHGNQTLQQVEEATGISKSKISDLENDSKNRGVAYQDICTLANYYGVSLDYLIGQAEYPTVNTDLRAVCEYTGLSPEAVRVLHNGTRQAADDNRHPALSNQEHYFAIFGPHALSDFINGIVVSSRGPYFITSMAGIAELVEDCKNAVEAFSDPATGDLRKAEIQAALSAKIKELRYRIFDTQDALRFYIDEQFHTEEIQQQIMNCLKQSVNVSYSESETADPQTIKEE